LSRIAKKESLRRGETEDRVDKPIDAPTTATMVRSTANNGTSFRLAHPTLNGINTHGIQTIGRFGN
jgi:hypothetical protein